MRGTSLALAAAIVLAGGSARAQCSKDTDCKGDRVCIGGQCADVVRPQPAAQPLPPPPPPVVQPAPQPVVVQPAPQPVIVQPAPQPAPAQPQSVNVIVNNNGPQQPLKLQQPKLGARPSPGRAVGSGIAGLIFAPIILGLAVGSDVSRGDTGVAVGLGSVALLLNLIMVPVTASGGSAARRGTDISGAVPLRVFGWIFFAGTIVGSVATMVLAAVDSVPDGLIASLGGVSALSLLFFAIDDFVCAGLASKWIDRQERGESASLEVGQYLAPYLTPDGHVGAAVGLVGRF